MDITIDHAAIADAIRKAGGARTVARKLGVSHQAVSQWVVNGVSAERAEAMAELSGVDVWVLCPRVFHRRKASCVREKIG
jgi:DNA-binding transcriptional regulator YdaS (Cro superfamily)